MTSLEPKQNEYAVLQNLDRFPQLPLMNLINLLSTSIHFLLFYLIYHESSRRESKLYRMVFLIKTMTFWAAQFHWGSLQSLVFLFPFPGIYNIGYLSGFIGSYALTTIWVIFFCTFGFSMFLILIIRLKALARTDGKLNFSTPTYIIILSLTICLFYGPMPFCWFSAYSSPKAIQEFVTRFYPKCVKILEVPGVFVYDDDWKFHRIIYCARILLASVGTLYLILCQMILYEIQQQCKIWSSHILKYHRKAMKDTFVQNFIMLIFLGLAPLVQILNAYKKPEDDTINLTMAANLIFVSAPIPCTLAVIFQNTYHREWIFRTFGLSEGERRRVIDSTNVLN